MIDLVGDTWVYSRQQPSQLYSNVLQEQKRWLSKQSTILLTPVVLPFHMKLIEQKLTALTFSSRVTLGTVVLSPSGSSVVLHGKSMLWPFYLLHYTGYKFEFQVLFFSYCTI